MLKSYFTIAWRNIMRSKVYSFINVAGLSLGVACCLLLALYIQDEMSFDKEHKRLDDIYRIITHFDKDIGFGQREVQSVSPPIAMAVAQEVPEVEAAARMLNPPDAAQNLITYKN